MAKSSIVGQKCVYPYWYLHDDIYKVICAHELQKLRDYLLQSPKFLNEKGKMILWCHLIYLEHISDKGLPSVQFIFCLYKYITNGNDGIAQLHYCLCIYTKQNMPKGATFYQQIQSNIFLTDVFHLCPRHCFM